jgi:hypothetical protein
MRSLIVADLGRGISSRSHFGGRVQEAAVQRQRSLRFVLFAGGAPSDADASTDSRDVNRLDSRRGRDPALYYLQP